MRPKNQTNKKKKPNNLKTNQPKSPKLSNQDGFSLQKKQIRKEPPCPSKNITLQGTNSEQQSPPKPNRTNAHFKPSTPSSPLQGYYHPLITSRGLRSLLIRKSRQKQIPQTPDFQNQVMKQSRYLLGQGVHPSVLWPPCEKSPAEPQKWGRASRDPVWCWWARTSPNHIPSTAGNGNSLLWDSGLSSQIKSKNNLKNPEVSPGSPKWGCLSVALLERTRKICSEPK